MSDATVKESQNQAQAQASPATQAQAQAPPATQAQAPPTQAPAPASAPSDKLTITDCVTQFLEWCAKIGKLIVAFWAALPLLWAVMWAALMLSLVVCVALLVMYLIYVINPRLPGVNHIVDIESYMKGKYVPALYDKIKDIKDYGLSAPQKIKALSGYEEAKTASEALMARNDLKNDLGIYFAFRSEIINHGNLIAAADLRTNAKVFVGKNGSLDEAAISSFKSAVVDNVDKLKEAAKSMSNDLQGRGDLRTFLGIDDAKDEGLASALKIATAAHEVRAKMEQAQDIKRLWMASRPTSTAIWTLYYAPFVIDVFTKRIPSTWISFPDDWTALFNTFMEMWHGLGDAVTGFPATIANMVAPGSSEGFRGSPMGAGAGAGLGGRKEKKNGREVIEGFGLGELFGLVRAVMNIMTDVTTIITVMGQLVMNFMNDPFGTLISMLVILLSVLITIPLTVLYFVITVLLIPWAVSAVLAYCITIQWCVWYTIFLIVTVVLVAIPYFFLWIFDIMTGGFVSRVMRCENEPSRWHSYNAYVDGNVYEQWPMSCWGRCSERYKPSYGGTCCQRLEGNMPDYCPQQQIYRIFSNNGVPVMAGPLAFVNYTPQSGFGSLTYDQRFALMRGAYQEKVKWYQSCYGKLDKYDYVNRHVCDNADLLFDKNPSAKEALATVCKEIFCDYVRGGSSASMTASNFNPGAPGGGNRASCARLKAIKDAGNGEWGGSGGAPGTDLVRRATIVAVAAALVVLSVRSLKAAWEEK